MRNIDDMINDVSILRERFTLLIEYMKIQIIWMGNIEKELRNYRHDKEEVVFSDSAGHPV